MSVKNIKDNIEVVASWIASTLLIGTNQAEYSLPPECQEILLNIENLPLYPTTNYVRILRVMMPYIREYDQEFLDYMQRIMKRDVKWEELANDFERASKSVYSMLSSKKRTIAFKTSYQLIVAVLGKYAEGFTISKSIPDNKYTHVAKKIINLAKTRKLLPLSLVDKTHEGDRPLFQTATESLLTAIFIVKSIERNDVEEAERLSQRLKLLTKELENIKTAIMKRNHPLMRFSQA